MREFKPQPIPTIAAALVFFLLIGLGRWQLNRMHEKQALFDAFSAGSQETLPLSVARSGEAVRYQHVRASGHYDNDRQFLLDNMTHNGSVGYRVLTPFATDGGDTVLVDRGWIPAGPTRSRLPDIRVSEEPRTVSGRLDMPPRRGIDLPAAPAGGWPRVLTYPKMADLSQALDRPLLGYILLLDADQPEGFVRDWRPSTFPPERHLGYAITWFALAAALAILYFFSQSRRRLQRP